MTVVTRLIKHQLAPEPYCPYRCHLGKTTILKQLKIIYGKGFTEEELLAYKNAASDNVFDSILSLKQGIDHFGVTVADPRTSAALALFDPDTRHKGQTLTPEMAEAALRIWEDETVQKVFERRSEFIIQDNAAFFISNAKRLTDPSFKPNQEGWNFLVSIARIRETYPHCMSCRLTHDSNQNDKYQHHKTRSKTYLDGFY